MGVQGDRSVWLSASVDDLPRTTTTGLLRAAVEDSPDEPALVDGNPEDVDTRRRWTHRELWDRSLGVAGCLLESYRPGERIAIWASNRPEWQIVQFGAAMAGLVVVTVNPALSDREAAFVLGKSGAAGVVVERTFRDEDLWRRARGLRGSLGRLRHVHPLDELAASRPAGGTEPTLPPVGPDDPAMILYTSGTTGFPKGAVLSHAGLTANASLFARRFGLGRGSVWVNPMPMFHLGGCSFGALGALSCRGVHVVHNFETAHTLRLAEQERATFLPIVPTMVVSMMEHPAFGKTDLSSVRLLAGGSTTIPASLVHQVEERFGASFGAIYGQTECAGVICQSMLDDDAEDKALRVGRPLDGTDLKVIAPATGEPVALGEVGELCVRSDSTFLEYFDEPEETARTKDADGWVHTGDLGCMDGRGFVQVTGRLKDMIVRGGENIYAREIEDLLYEHGVAVDVAVVGLPDEYWGEQVAAFVRTRGDAPLDVEQCTTWLRHRLASSKVPRYWIQVDRMPMTSSGKLQKFALRDGFLRGEYVALAAPTPRAPRAEVVARRDAADHGHR